MCYRWGSVDMPWKSSLYCTFSAKSSTSMQMFPIVTRIALNYDRDENQRLQRLAGLAATDHGMNDRTNHCQQFFLKCSHVSSRIAGYASQVLAQGERFGDILVNCLMQEQIFRWNVNTICI